MAAPAAPEQSDHLFQHPFAASPDIIRSNQKDAYFIAHLQDRLSTILRRLCGARVAHANAQEVGAASSILYLGLTTLIGNRTLGEEFSDIVPVEVRNTSPKHDDSAVNLPSARRRVGYILVTVLLPYWLGRGLPALRRKLRARLEAGLQQGNAGTSQDTKQDSAIQTGSRPAPTMQLARAYLLANLDALTSPAPIHAASLAIFYFSGAYYTLSKRLFRLRYIFTRASEQTRDANDSYELLGVLLVLQLSVQAYVHVRQSLASAASSSSSTTTSTRNNDRTPFRGYPDVSADPQNYTSNNALLFSTDPSLSSTSASTTSRIQSITHTPAPPDGQPRYELADPDTMAWVTGSQSRKCTLCLEGMRDPSATTCGHVFCWSCIVDWCREKPECPLCRQPNLPQRVLPLRA